MGERRSLEIRETAPREQITRLITSKITTFSGHLTRMGVPVPVEVLSAEEKRVASSLVSEECVARYLFSGRELVAIIAVTPSAWDTDHFGIKTAKLATFLLHESVPEDWQMRLAQEFVRMLKRRNYKLIMARVPLTENAAINSLFNLRGCLCDVLLTFHLDADNFSKMGRKPPGEISTSRADQKDLTFLKELSEVSFRLGHLHADRRLDSKLSDKAYGVIISNQVQDNSWVVIKVSKGEEPAGFISFSLVEQGGSYKNCQISLLAVRSSMSRIGLGTLLVTSAIEWSRRSGARDVIVSTQATNFPAIALYERLGFRLVQSYASLHLWLD